ncbi:MAG: hypothetical protein MSD82_11605 [Prevotella sp.]|nr:hypothetical protein [Prevotella sp.]
MFCPVYSALSAILSRTLKISTGRHPPAPPRQNAATAPLNRMVRTAAYEEPGTLFRISLFRRIKTGLFAPEKTKKTLLDMNITILSVFFLYYDISVFFFLLPLCAIKLRIDYPYL